MTPLRKRMIEQMAIRNFTESTKDVYVAAVARFARHFARSPETMGVEDVRAYQLYLIAEDYSKSYIHVSVSAIRFLYNDVLQRAYTVVELPYPKLAKPLPDVLSKSEVLTLLSAPANLRERTILLTAYATGLRSFEVAKLRISDIDSARMVVKVVNGKGQKDRYVMLSPTLLAALREYWVAYKPREWLFPSKLDPTKPMTSNDVFSVCKRAVVDSGLTKPITPRLIRHSFATHLLEDGTDIRVVQALMGHASIRSTTRYTRVSTRTIASVRSPLDTLKEPPPPAPRG